MIIHERVTHLSFANGGYATLLGDGGRFIWRGLLLDDQALHPTNRIRYLSPRFTTRSEAIAHAQMLWHGKIRSQDYLTTTYWVDEEEVLS